MPNLSRRSFAGWLGTGMLLQGSPGFLRPPSSNRFTVYGALLHSNEPDLRQWGINPIYLFDRGIWKDGESRFSTPDPDLVAERIERLPNDGAPLVMDFEFYKTRTREEAIASREGLRRITETFARYAGDRPIGIYEYLPRRNYWGSIGARDSPEFKEWQDLNTLMSSLARSVDLVFPSLYTFHDNPTQWQRYARAQISEARRISNKPVIPFIWPDFHYNGTAGTLEPIPRKFWRLQLETLVSIADGIVIWGGWDPISRERVPWDNQAPWWIETLCFLQGQ
ncbi:hyaluronidase [Qipengyuania sp. 1XM1-15A]|uniref:hyaluronidase n=1 Tax=Qipengyuania xiamenensis TaxID=2867237 RepID=UPI001C86B47A|nr:hyaluronidase [Qipengyuania xiamenensis]MBX7531762.1 hyaluronidase [Qipengyuania xiamenensis]